MQAPSSCSIVRSPAAGWPQTAWKSRSAAPNRCNLGCNLLVNSAGLHAPALARSIAGMPSQLIPGAYFAKGNYFTLTGRSPFARLIYPVPVPGGLGVHLTLDSGRGSAVRTRCRVDRQHRTTQSIHIRADGFYAAVRRYWPELKEGALQPG